MKNETWRWLLSSLREYRVKITLMLVAAVVLGAANAAIPLLLQRLIDSATQGEFNNVVATVLICASFVTAFPMVGFLRNKLVNLYQYELRGYVTDHLLRLDMSFHDTHGSTTIVTQVAKGISAAGRLIHLTCNGQILVQIPVAIFAAYYVFTYSSVAFACLTSYLLVFGFAGKIAGAKLAKVEEAYQEIDTEITHRQREAVQHIPVVKVHHARSSELENYWKRGGEALVLRDKLNYLNSIFWFLSQSARGFSYTVAVFVFIPMIINGNLTAGTFFALAMYSTQMLQPASFLGDLYAEIKRMEATLVPLIGMLKEYPDVNEQKNALELSKLNHEIALKDVSFRYPGSDKDILHGVSLTVPARKKTAIVGHSGSGKTTLAKLIARLYDPTEGVVSFDGTDVRNVSFASLYEQLAYLSQEVPVFSGSVKDNVSYGMSSCDDEAVYEALDNSSAHFVTMNEEGLDEQIGEMGKKLSGGERQRIALARIFMRKPSIIVLDEATSALDTVTESSVHNAFDELAKLDEGKTMIVIAHRLSTVKNADQIVVMDMGKIVDIGTHEELMEKSEKYRELNKDFVV